MKKIRNGFLITDEEVIKLAEEHIKKHNLSLIPSDEKIEKFIQENEPFLIEQYPLGADPTIDEVALKLYIKLAFNKLIK